MIKVNKFLYSDNIQDIIEVMLDIRILSDRYNIHNLREEYYLESWMAIISQNSKDRECKRLNISVNSEYTNKKINIKLSSNERATIVDYIIDNNLDLKYGLKLIKRTNSNCVNLIKNSNLIK